MRIYAALPCLASLALAIMPQAASAQETTKPTKGETLRKAEGVILKVEMIGGDSQKDGPRAARITVNTAAMWSDYVRDQASTKGKDSAKKGEDSIATQGQPADANNTFLIEVGTKTQLMTRFRAASDETNEGSRTVEGAEKKEGSPASEDVKHTAKDTKAPKTMIGDLKVGQFVEVEAKEGKASRLVVLKPVRDPEKTEKVVKPSK